MKKIIDTSFFKILPVIFAFMSGDMVHADEKWVRGIGASLLLIAALVQGFNHARMETK
jgi:hypothetical protein